MRTEKDLLSEMELPDDALYGIEAARARDNFMLGYGLVRMELVYAIVKIKKASALSLARLTEESGESEKFRAIAAACDYVLEGRADDAFITDALQGGAGTSTHMNVNEVLANAALVILGKTPGDYAAVHPFDDVNRYQSTNDVYPTALRIAAITLLRELSSECAALQESLQKKENEYGKIRKLGRTELMDAVPVTLGEEFGAYAQAVARDRWRIYKVEERLRQVNLGGAAVGSSGKETLRYRGAVMEELRSMTGIGLAAAEYPMDLTQNCDVFVEASGLLKALAVNLSKIAGDLRLAASGPCGGLGEIRLAPLQKGSTIMAGKINPVIPEMIIQLCIKIFANDAAISMAASRGEFELNAFTPIIAESLLESLTLLKNGCRLFREKCIELLVPDEARCAELLDGSWAFAASYVSRLGYEAVSRIIFEHAISADAAGDGADSTSKIRAALDAAVNSANAG